MNDLNLKMKFQLKVNDHGIRIDLELHNKVVESLSRLNIDEKLFLNKSMWGSILYQELRKKDFTPFRARAVKVVINGFNQHSSGKKMMVSHKQINGKPLKRVTDVGYLVKGYTVYYLIFLAELCQE